MASNDTYLYQVIWRKLEYKTYANNYFKNTLKIKDLKEKKKEEIAAYEYKEWEQSIGLDFVDANGPGF